MVKVTDRIKETKEKIIITKEKINSLDFDAHWYRRVFHAFGASFLVYYMLPNIDWVNLLKFWIPMFIIIFAFTLEWLRLKGRVSSDHFFGLRIYEQNRIGSYVFFAVAILILLLFFPQQIAIPCILCATIGDPVMGEIRNRLGMNYVYFFGFLLCMIFFMISWLNADVKLIILISVVGGLGAVIGETKKFWWLDDDFMIQIVPALFLLIIWFVFPFFGVNMPTDYVISPGLMLW
jgi:hypothetical protein